ncbi:GNAT family N-acetyltransferase [Salinisphaera sp. Q1T1-3]|uniref:GNAT family N-acetyltransferase n=1 Tax=Salinisphaera sp. Q1T1-3 TaxID=2321229 RepID=UPI000E74C7C9|nr:GNAT family N-acetyltransferase [Salinisphaera sp. Q1T1-3]RJS91504.1 GNAT family N-acetyltransferase [Salinisphaera sp. Q1T1-3]
MNAPAPIHLLDADTPERLADLSALAHIIWQQHYVPLIGQAQVEYMLAEGYSDEALMRDHEAGKRFTLAMRGERAIGFAAVSPPEPSEPDCAWLDKLYVAQEARNLGVGRRLVERAAWQIDEFWSAEKMALRVNRHNDSSITAYKAMGFAICDTDVKPIGQGFVMDDYIMRAPRAHLANRSAASN